MGDIGPVRAHYEVLPEPVEYAPARQVEQSPARGTKTEPLETTREPDGSRRDAPR